MRATITRTVPTLRMLAVRACRIAEAAYLQWRIRNAETDIAHMRRELERAPDRIQSCLDWTAEQRVKLAQLHARTP